MKKIYKLLYILFGKKLCCSDTLFLGKISKRLRGFWFRRINTGGRNINIDKNVTFGYNISIGNNSGIGKNSYVQNNVIIGDDVLCGPEVLIYTSNHRYDFMKKFINSGVENKDVQIGNNVWIGTRVIILPGCHIGNNCIIGAGAVVTKSFPDNVLIAGNPAVVKKKLQGDKK